ncbi:hypothetical protein BC835DRAFT_915960 [Cytidiella melzeri]|nr:hypothetical protein BC835DRAFT_915960 [Cytidiella melzeri]
MLEEVDLEIAVQERIASVLESRVNWALLLQQTLESSRCNVPWTIPGFQDSVLTALETAEKPCSLFYTQDLRLPYLPPPVSFLPIVSPSPPSVELADQPSPVYTTRHRSSKRSAPAPPRKLLYLRNHATQPPQTVKLACPDCGKTSFSSLQGLLNHCRLSHSREFGSHDECVQDCAVLVETAEDQAWVVANGTEVAGISIPGLRRLFELAVGGGQGIVPILPLKQLEVDTVDRQSSFSTPSQLPEESSLPSSEASSHVTRTLGHHIDTPALAPFLGREAKRRSIHSYAEDVDVDILGQERASKTSQWRMHYTHRSKARSSLDEVVKLPAAHPAVEEVSPDIQDVAEAQAALLSFVTSGTGSRFHIMARLSIKDLSLWIPPSRRSQTHPEYTHKWRLAVSSPSYSLPLSTFLTKLTITNLTKPALFDPITVTKPPFVVTGLTDRPFLARLTFEWSGSDALNPPLDPIHYSTPVLGEEQFFDVELDRNTEFMPDSGETDAPSWDVEGHAENVGAIEPEEHQEEPDHFVWLRSLLSQFPMTSRDGKGRSLPVQVPYTLVSTPAQLRNLVYGRRKAIEWGRAHALRSAYEERRVSSSEDHTLTPVSLTTGDVFHWLEDEGLFLRKPKCEYSAGELPNSSTRKLRPETKSAEELSEAYCRFCGLHAHLHLNDIAEHDASFAPEAMSYPVKPGPIFSKSPAQSLCRRFQSSVAQSELPVVDINHLMVSSEATRPSTLHVSLFARQRPGKDITPSATCSVHRLLSVSDPHLVRAIAASLAHPPNETAGIQAPHAHVGLHNRPRAALDNELGPAALLALVVKPLVKLLVEAGTDTYRQDEDEFRGLGGRARRDVRVRRLLTPMHVVRGLVRDAERSTLASAVLLSLAPLGVSLAADAPTTEDLEAAVNLP